MKYYVQIFGDPDIDHFFYDVAVIETHFGIELNVGDPLPDFPVMTSSTDTLMTLYVKRLSTAGTRLSISDDADDLPGIQAVTEAVWLREQARSKLRPMRLME
jgi:hypothetical protein